LPSAILLISLSIGRGGGRKKKERKGLDVLNLLALAQLKAEGEEKFLPGEGRGGACLNCPCIEFALDLFITISCEGKGKKEKGVTRWHGGSTYFPQAHAPTMSK